MTRDSPDCKSPVNRQVIVRHDAAIVDPVDCPHLSRDFADILRGVRDKESRSCTDLWNRKSVWMTARSRALLHRLGCHSVKDEQDLANDVAFNLMKQLPKPGLAWVTTESTFEKIAMCQIKQLGSDIYRKYDLEQSRTVCQSDMREATGGRVTWSYDRTQRLVNEFRSGASSYNTTYTYDATGN
jgi:hypothetical protein